VLNIKKTCVIILHIDVCVGLERKLKSISSVIQGQPLYLGED
jgi:hypothetical protein